MLTVFTSGIHPTIGRTLRTVGTGPGGRAAFLDQLADPRDSSQIPAKPILSYVGAANFPVDGLVFESSEFVDPQGGVTAQDLGLATSPVAPFTPAISTGVDLDPKFTLTTPISAPGTWAAPASPRSWRVSSTM